MGAIDTKHGTCSLECTGIVVQVGNNVASLKVGDKVIVMAPGHFATFEDVPEWACCKIGEDDDLNVSSFAGLALREREEHDWLLHY